MIASGDAARFRTIPAAALECWLRTRYFTTPNDLSCSGLESYTLGQLANLCDLNTAQLADTVFDDSPSEGSEELRAAIAGRWADGRAERVVVTHGSSEAIFLAMNALLQPGDLVVTLDPIYHSLRAVATSLGCRTKPWSLRWTAGFHPDLSELRALLAHDVRMVVLNFPHNPTGATLSTEEQDELLEMVARSGAYLLWDEALADLTFGCARLPNPVIRYERAVSVGTLSKGPGLPGIRVGWLIGPPAIVRRCLELKDYTTLSVSPLLERIATRAVCCADALLAPRLRQSASNRDLLESWCARHPDQLRWVRPRAGVTGFPRFADSIDTDRLCEELARAGTLLVPGSCFGQPAHARIGFGGNGARFRRGLDQLEEALASPHV